MCEPSRPKYRKDDFDEGRISEEIHFQVCKMLYIGWKHKVKFKRKIKTSFADIFQDIVAYYLKAALPKEYEIILEEKKLKIRPDILIKKGKKCFAVEIKTSLGYEPLIFEKKETYAPYEKRRDDLSEAFNIPEDNVLYILSKLKNNGKGFPDQFKRDKNLKIIRPKLFPYSIIYPLFEEPDPYYWKWPNIKNKEKDKKYPDENEINDRIKEKQKENIIAPFEEILRKIKK